MEIMSVKEVSKYLNCSESCIRNMVREKKIPFFKLKSKLNFRKATIDLWVQNQELINASDKNYKEPISIMGINEKR